MMEGVALQPYASAEISGQVYVTQERLVSELRTSQRHARDGGTQWSYSTHHTRAKSGVASSSSEDCWRLSTHVVWYSQMPPEQHTAFS